VQQTRHARRKSSPALVGGDGGGVLGCRCPIEGATVGCFVLQHEVLRVKTLSITGLAAVAPSASHPPWRRRLMRPVACSLRQCWWWMFGGVACAQRKWKCATSVSAGRCRGLMGVGCLELMHNAAMILVSARRR
jgi:hypothetical protein